MSKPTIILDAGHGGHDPGALGPNGTRESDMALDVCKRALKMLKPVSRVLLTRSQDIFKTLNQRPSLANREDADLFVSYHFNSATNPSVALSWEIFTTPGQNNSDTLATLIGEEHERLHPLQKGRKDIADGDLDKEAWFTVIRRTKCPSVLVEGEFIHTQHGEAYILDEGNRHRMAQAVAIGCARYLSLDVSKLDLEEDFC